MGKTFITGATGFVGSAVARALIKEGHELKVLIRSEKYLENLKGLKFETVQGDLTDPESLKKGMEGCSKVFHVAALYLMWTRHPEMMHKVNVEGTRNVLSAALQNGIERVIYTSSVAAIGHRKDGVPSDETVEWNLDWIGDPYVKSKHLAMQVAKEYVAKGLHVVTVCPSAPLGPNDIKPTPTGQMICDFLNGMTPVYLRGGFNLVDVDDVAQGHLLADTRGHKGEVYILGGTNITLKDMYKMLSQLSDVSAPALFLPHGVDLFSAWMLTKIADWIVRKPPLITLGGCRMVKLPPFYDHTKAKKELGYSPRPLEETMIRSIRYFRKMGYAKK